MIRRRLDEIFSRRMLGSVLVGLAGGKIIESIVNMISLTPKIKFWLWGILFVLFVALFVCWEYVQRTVEDAAEKAAESVEVESN